MRGRVIKGTVIRIISRYFTYYVTRGGGRKISSGKSFVTDDVLARRFRLFFHVYDRFLVSSDYEVDFISLKMTRAL